MTVQNTQKQHHSSFQGGNTNNISNNSGRWNSGNKGRGIYGGGRWNLSDTNAGRWSGRRNHGRGGRFSTGGRGRPFCSHCNEVGHWIDTCWELHGYPPTHPKAKSDQPKAANNITLASGDEEGTITMSKAHLEQLLSLLNNQDLKTGTTSNPKANTAAKSGLQLEVQAIGVDDFYGFLLEAIGVNEFLQCVEHTVDFKMSDNEKGEDTDDNNYRTSPRDFFVSTQENWLLLATDYSQIELRLMAHFSKDPSLVELLTIEQFHIVGDDPVLGQWDPSRAVPFNWSDGHVWTTTELDVPIEKCIKFKIIIKEGPENIIWQPGPDQSQGDRSGGSTWQTDPQFQAFESGFSTHN
ncbi:hypothetical protein POM88_035032 [Heracleum sosnowskyi]|uniref:CBM20 domain-containing protein n=1 Tax=Heracleum sosnowskyi TaxID=360622 RepID=A0AAD8MB52_9APIA|nr:hypothetical protein POM88_035032 [Heracleum sosnowskyi]